jgi:glycosyltransferase involved in cell wall biosynthesis
MLKANSISIVIPAMNEEGNVAAAVKTVKSVVSPCFSDHEILIYNDGSTDGTGIIADELARGDSSIKVFHHDKNRGLGACYREGARVAGKDFYLLIHGDNEIAPETIQAIINKTNEADVVIPYVQNPEARPFIRRVISSAYVSLTNLLFGLNIPYYNGPCMIRTSLVKELPIEDSGFGFMMETLVKLIKKGHSYVVVGFNCRLREKGKTKVFQIRNISSAIAGIIRLRLKLSSFWKEDLF